MQNQSAPQPQNLRAVTVPLGVSQIKEYFDNKELFFLVDYAQSKIKGSMFLTYMSNLGLPGEIVLTGASTEEKFDLLKVYLESRNISTSAVLKVTAAQVLLESRGISTAGIVDAPVLSPEECRAFAAAHSELIRKYVDFIAATPLFMLTSIPHLEERFRFKEKFPVVDDAYWIGSNVCQLYSVPSFVELFLSKPAGVELRYYRAQFEELMFKGKNLLHYFYCPENTLFLVYLEMLSGKRSYAEVQKMFPGVS